MRVLLVLMCGLGLLAQNPPSTPDKGVLAGKVLNSATGEPVRKAQVVLFNLSEEGKDKEKSQGGHSAVTDAAGGFEFTDVSPGSYALIAARDGFVAPKERGKPVTLAPGEERRDLALRLVPFGVISGRIMDEDGDPIRRMEVITMDYQYTATGRHLSDRANATTNDLGEYRIFDLQPGRYYLKAGTTGMMNGTDDSFAPSYYPGTPDSAGAAAIEVGAGQQVAGIDLTLHPMRLATIRGRVVNPGENLTVGLIHVTENGSGTSATSVDDPKGKFELRGVLPGSYTLVASGTIGGRQLSAYLPVQVGSADLEKIELHLALPMEIAGQIRMEGPTAAKMSRVSVLLEGGGRSLQGMSGGEPKEDGSFVLEGLEPGVYQVTVNAPEDLYLKAVRWADRDAMESGVDLTQGAAASLVVVLSANGGQIDGTVEDDQPAPVADAWVALVPAESGRKKALFKLARSGAGGHFHLRAIAPGSYKLFAFEEVDPNRLMYDPDFLRPFDSQGQSLDISEGGKASVRLKMIPHAGPAADQRN